MGFSSFHNTVQNPAKRFYKWSAGHKEEVALQDGTKADKIRGVLTYFDKELGENGENVEVALPFRFCVLEQSRSISGFSPTPGANISYFSNETVDYDEVMVVSRRDEQGTREVIRGTYQQIKDKLPQGARLQLNLYIYNPESDQIERINLQGSSMSAFIDATKKNRGIYERMTTLEGSGELKTNGSVKFEPPKFSISNVPYTDEEMKKLFELDTQIVDYFKYRRSQNAQNYGGDSSEDASIDQTPATYSDEQSQEVEDEDFTKIEMTDVPF